MAKSLLSVFSLLLLASCYSSFPVHSIEVQEIDVPVMHAGGHHVIEEYTGSFYVKIYLDKLTEGEALDLKVRLLNLSDSILEVYPEMWSLRYMAADGTTRRQQANNPLTTIVDSHHDIEKEERAMRNGYPGGSMGVAAGTTALALLVGDEDPSPEADAAVETYRGARYRQGQERLSRLYKDLEEISQYWLHRTTLYPQEYIEGSLRLVIPKGSRQAYIYFQHNREILSIPIKINRQ